MLTAMTHFLLRRTVKKWFDTDTDPAATRRKIARFIGLTDRLPRGWSVTPVAGQPRLHMIAPEAPLPPEAPLTLYLHGGGYYVGGLATHAAFAARLGRASGGRVLFADYRLAPEHQFPAAFDDALDAWLKADGMAHGPLILAGDSAGGGLALAVCQAARHAHLREPGRLILLSPWLDMTLSGDSLSANAATDSMLSREILGKMRALYLGDQDPADRRASPLFDTLAPLPPTLVIYSQSEVLRDDATRLIERLRANGTAVTALPVADMPHVFPLFATLPAAGRALTAIAAFCGAQARSQAVLT
jgi:acetyl esterase/lipase